MAPDQRAGRAGKLAGEMPDAARGAVDQHLAAEQQPALAQRMQRGQAGDRQGRGLRVADRVGQRGDRVAAAIDPLGPGARRQEADDARAGLWGRCRPRAARSTTPAKSQPGRQPGSATCSARRVSPRLSEIAVT